jgi:hypothetical protein
MYFVIIFICGVSDGKIISGATPDKSSHNRFTAAGNRSGFIASVLE